MIPQGDNGRYQAGRGYPLKFQKNKKENHGKPIVVEHIYRDKEDSKGCVGDCGSSDRNTDGVGMGGVISKYYLAGRQRNRGIKCDPNIEYRNGVIYRNGVLTLLNSGFAGDSEDENEENAEKCQHRNITEFRGNFHKE